MSKKVRINKPQVILCDIEGTTTSISFVKDCLFPYVRQQLESYLDTHWGEKQLDEIIDLLKKQAEEDVSLGVVDVVPMDNTKESVISNVLLQMDGDRKTKALKALQGLIWRNGYESGIIKGHIYDDVPSVLNEWKVKDAIKIYIYSSGSVLAQKLLFSHTTHGDLSHLIDGYFDITIGGKLVRESYSNISNAINCQPNTILFLTDVPKEAEAAKEAGMNVILVVREGNAPLDENDSNQFDLITSFEDIQLTFN